MVIVTRQKRREYHGSRGLKVRAEDFLLGRSRARGTAIAMGLSVKSRSLQY